MVSSQHILQRLDGRYADEGQGFAGFLSSGDILVGKFQYQGVNVRLMVDGGITGMTYSWPPLRIL
jgi:hypothetical protein